MRLLGLFGAAALLVSCVTRGWTPIEPPGHVTYYDRNGDGIVDYELHAWPGHADADWALIDTKFRGQYDLRVDWGYVFEKHRIDMPVPRHVKITPGKPPKYYMPRSHTE
jgi:hypothetical protein